MGPQPGVADPRFRCHQDYYKKIKATHDILTIENVPEYSVEIPASELGHDWRLESAVIDPRHLGIPASRARLFVLAWNTRKVKLRGDVCFGCFGTSLYDTKMYSTALLTTELGLVPTWFLLPHCIAGC